MNYESIIFDIDGTIWDCRKLVAEGYNLQLCDEGYEHLCTDEERVRPMFGKNLQGIADMLLATVPVPERYALMKRCMDREVVHMQKDPCQTGYPRIREVMEELSKKHRLFIVSNSEAGYPEMCMEKLGLTPYIQGTLCYGLTGKSKGQTILMLMKAHNITDAVYIGDTQGDYEATVEAGIPFIWAAYGFGTPDGYDKKIQSPDELLNM